MAELKVQIQCAPVAPVVAVLGFRDADGGTVTEGDIHHLLVGPALGVEHIEFAVRCLADDHGVGGAVIDGIPV